LAGTPLWLNRWGAPASYPACIPPPLGGAVGAEKGGSVTFLDLGVAIKKFPGKFSGKNSL